MRQNGQLTWASPATGVAGAGTGDSLATGAIVRMFTATERVTVVEVGVISSNSAVNPVGTGFTFNVKKRVGAVAANDTVIDVFTSPNAAESGPVGNTKIASGLITNTANLLVAGSALRAYCEVTLNKGDQLVFTVVGTSTASATGIFYAKVYPDGAGLVEANDVESN